MPERPIVESMESEARGGFEHTVAQLSGIGTEYYITTRDGSTWSVAIASGRSCKRLADGLTWTSAVMLAGNRIAEELRGELEEGALPEDRADEIGGALEVAH